MKDRLSNWWKDCSVRRKFIFLVGMILVAMWALVLFIIVQQNQYTARSAVIMDTYKDITGFMEAFSGEQVQMDSYVRPSILRKNAAEYAEASAHTDDLLQQLVPDLESDSQEEYMLKRSIYNSMRVYRITQQQMMEESAVDQIVLRYLLLQRQSVYIDDYARHLLHERMLEGGAQWEDIERTNQRSNAFLGGLVIAATLISVLSVSLMVRGIVVPLSSLAKAADEIGAGRYDTPVRKLEGGNEVGRVARSFDLMQTEIRRTIDALEREREMEKHLLEKEVESVQMQKALQIGRFAQLQSQINPHFLFNTLNTIAAVAEEERAPMAVDLITRLSHFFRYSLESDEHMVTLGRELSLLRDYLEIQDARFGGRIETEIDSPDPIAEQCIVPKFIIQPLVENSFNHGLRSCGSGGRIRVRVRRREGCVRIWVTDNGVGFDRRNQKSSTNHHSVGLDNIAERMQLAGGRLDLFSIFGVGTSARITIGTEETE